MLLANDGDLVKGRVFANGFSSDDTGRAGA
jgi:hypothetical protein